MGPTAELLDNIFYDNKIGCADFLMDKPTGKVQIKAG
jgi:hypothetical protein